MPSTAALSSAESKVPTLAIASGPCTAIMPNSGRSVIVISKPAACLVIQARSFSRVAELTTKR